MISFLRYFPSKSILFLIDDNIFSAILLLFSFFMLEKVSDREVNREKIHDECHFLFIEDEEEDYLSMNIIFCPFPITRLIY
jgi:hypothetical protein